MCDVIIHVEISNWTSPQHSKRYMAIVHPSWSWSVLMKECRIYYTPIFLLFAFLIIIIIYRWKLPWLTNALNKIMIPMVDGGFGTFILYWRQTGGRRSQFFFFFFLVTEMDQRSSMKNRYGIISIYKLCVATNCCLCVRGNWES